MERSQRELRDRLHEFLAARFAGITIEIAPNERWERPCVTFRWEGFAGLLPEERFHRLMRHIPEDLRRSEMGELIWLELAPGETIDDFLGLPRSEDAVGREREIYAELAAARFFEQLGVMLGASPDKACQGGFSATAHVLGRTRPARVPVNDAKLLFIHHGVYCDCQALQHGRERSADRQAEIPANRATG